MKKTLAIGVLAIVLIGTSSVVALSPMFAKTVRAESATIGLESSKGQLAADAAQDDANKAAAEARAAGADEATARAAGQAAYEQRIAQYNASRDSGSDDSKDGYKNCNIAHLGACMRDWAAFLIILQVQLLLFFLGIAGAILDLALSISFLMGDWMGQGSPVGKAIELGWKQIRDIGNLIFIAGLIWASIAMILGIQAGSNPPGKLVTKIIIVALLVNFSYFFAGVLIDASNTFSKIAYGAGIKGVAESSIAQETGVFVGVIHDESGKAVKEWLDKIKLPYVGTAFSGVFLEKTRLVSILDSDYLAENTEGLYTGKFFAVMVFASIIFGTTIYNFATMAFSIIARLVILMILLVTSPLMVLKFVDIEPFKKWGDHWWGALVSQLVFLPVFIILTMISFNILGSFSNAVAGGPSNVTGIALGALGGIASKDIDQILSALGMLLIFAMGWGLLRASRVIAHNIATQTETKLPSVGMLQGPALKFGETVGKVATQLANLPRSLSSKLLIGGGARVIGGIAGVSGELGGALMRASGIPAMRRAVEGGFERMSEWAGGWTPEGRRKKAARISREATRDKIDALIAEMEDPNTTPARREEIKKQIASFFTSEASKKEASQLWARWRREGAGGASKQNSVASAIGGDEGAKRAKELDNMANAAAPIRKAQSAESKAEGSAMTTANAALANRMAAGEAAAYDDFKTLAYLEQQQILIANKEILSDKRNTQLLVDALGREKFGQHLGSMPIDTYKDSRIRENTAPHMTYEGFVALNKQIPQGGDQSAMWSIRSEMEKTPEGKAILAQYDAEPRARIKNKKK